MSLSCWAGEGISGRIGKNADSFFMFYPTRLAGFPFYSVFEQHTVCGKSKQFERSAGIDIHSIAMIFSKDDAVFLVRSSLSAEQFRKKSASFGAASVQAVKVASHNGFRFTGGNAYGVKGDNALILFTGKDEFLFGEEKKLTRYLSGGIGGNDEVKKCFAFLRPGAAAYGVLTAVKAGQNGFLQSGNAGTIAFSLSRMEGMPSPVVAEVLFFPSSSARLMSLYNELKEYIANVYQQASAKGPVPAEMRHAFTVTMSYGFVRLDVALTDQNGKEFFRILLSRWKN